MRSLTLGGIYLWNVQTAKIAPRAVLESNFLFRGLPAGTLDRIAALGKRRSYKKGAVVFSQGDDGDALCGVVAGRVEISASDGEGAQISLNIMEPGDSFGEIALIDGKSRTASAVAMEASDLLVVDRRHFVELMRAVHVDGRRQLCHCGARALVDPEWSFRHRGVAGKC